MYYVYTLARPDGRIFYVGKGSEYRAKGHLTEARKGECICQKCRIIQKILKSGKEVRIEYVFETEDERAAFEREATLIAELSQTMILCNKSHNQNRRLMPKSGIHMTLAEYTAYIDQYELPKKESAAKIDEWCDKRIAYLEREWRSARRHNELEEAETLMQEIELLLMKTGRVHQHQFPFTFLRRKSK